MTTWGTASHSALLRPWHGVTSAHETSGKDGMPYVGRHETSLWKGKGIGCRPTRHSVTVCYIPLRRSAFGSLWFPLLRPQERAFAGWRIASQCLPCHAGRVPDGASRNRLPGWVFGFRPRLRAVVRSRAGALLRNACPATQGGCLTAPPETGCPVGFLVSARASARSCVHGLAHCFAMLALPRREGA